MFNGQIHKLDIDKRSPLTIWSNGCVKFQYKGYTFSISSDGQDVLVDNSEGRCVYCEMIDDNLLETLNLLKEKVDNH